MTKQQIAWLIWLDSRTDAGDESAIAAALSALIAATSDRALSNAENALHNDEKITIGFLHQL